MQGSSTYAQFKVFTLVAVDETTQRLFNHNLRQQNSTHRFFISSVTKIIWLANSFNKMTALEKKFQHLNGY